MTAGQWAIAMLACALVIGGHALWLRRQEFYADEEARRQRALDAANEEP